MNRYKQLKQNKADPYKFILFAGIFLFSLSLCYKIFCAGSYAVRNEELEHLIARKAELQTEVALLDYKNSRCDNLKIIELAAAKMGFIKADASVIAIEMSSGSYVAAAKP